MSFSNDLLDCQSGMTLGSVHDSNVHPTFDEALHESWLKPSSWLLRRATSSGPRIDFTSASRRSARAFIHLKTT
jgi:hypothetical protein